MRRMTTTTTVERSRWKWLEAAEAKARNRIEGLPSSFRRPREETGGVIRRLLWLALLIDFVVCFCGLLAESWHDALPYGFGKSWGVTSRCSSHSHLAWCGSFSVSSETVLTSHFTTGR